MAVQDIPTHQMPVGPKQLAARIAALMALAITRAGQGRILRNTDVNDARDMGDQLLERGL